MGLVEDIFAAQAATSDNLEAMDLKLDVLLQRVQALVEQGNGATTEQLQDILAGINAIKGKSDAVSAELNQVNDAANPGTPSEPGGGEAPTE